MDSSVLSQPLTWGIIVILAAPHVVRFAQWLGKREIDRSEEANRTRDKRIADLEAINAAKQLADVARDRDISEVKRAAIAQEQQLKDGLATLDTRLQKSSEAQAKAMREMQIELKQEISRVMREAVNERRPNAKR